MKSFVPYILGNDTFYKWLGTAAALANHEAFTDKVDTAYLSSRDPSGADWGTIGFAPVAGSNSYVHDLDGAARLLCIQFNDRILPGTVILEKIIARAKEIEQRDGRKVSKKGYAEIREQIEEELLPTSHIRRTIVPVLVYKDLMLIFTTSAKKLDDIHVKLFKLANLKATVKFSPEGVRYNESINFILKQIAGNADVGSDENYSLEATNAAKLKGSDKRTITIKDREVWGDEVQKLLVGDNYSVSELRMHLVGNFEGADPENMLEFSFNENGHFKAVKMSDSSTAGLNKDDLHTSCWIIAKQCKTLVAVMTDALGGVDDGEL